MRCIVRRSGSTVLHSAIGADYTYCLHDRCAQGAVGEHRIIGDTGTAQVQPPADSVRPDVCAGRVPAGGIHDGRIESKGLLAAERRHCT